MAKQHARIEELENSTGLEPQLLRRLCLADYLYGGLTYDGRKEDYWVETDKEPIPVLQEYWFEQLLTCAPHAAPDAMRLFELCMD